MVTLPRDAHRLQNNYICRTSANPFYLGLLLVIPSGARNPVIPITRPFASLGVTFKRRLFIPKVTVLLF